MGSGFAVGALISASSAAAQAGVTAKQNSKSRAFIREQRETAFQTQRADLTAAGYNPLYAFQSSNRGASTNAAPVLDAGKAFGQAAVSSGIDAYRAKQELKNLKADYDLKRNQAAAANAAANLGAAQSATETSKLKLNNVNSALLEEQLPGAKFEAQMDNSIFGKATRALQRLNPLKGLKGKR